MQNKLLWVAVMVLGVVTVGYGVSAYSGSAQNVTESINVAGDYKVYSSPSEQGSLGGGEMLGAAVASDANWLSQEPKPTALGATYFSDDVEINDVLYADEVYASGTVSLAGDTSIVNLVGSGTATTLSPTSTQTTMTLTAAQVCDSSVLLVDVHATGTQLTITLPATTTLLADCIDAAGEWKDVQIIGDSVTSTILAAGSGGTLLVSSSSTVQGGDAAILRLIADTASTYKALLINAL